MSYVLIPEPMPSLRRLQGVVLLGYVLMVCFSSAVCNSIQLITKEANDVPSPLQVHVKYILFSFEYQTLTITSVR